MAQATDGTDPDLVVAKLVEEVTDDKSLDKQERKRLQIVNASKNQLEPKFSKLADKISNLRDIAASPPPDWSVKRRLDMLIGHAGLPKGWLAFLNFSNMNLMKLRPRPNAQQYFGDDLRDSLTLIGH
jgi:hypothetical protein